MSPLWGFLLSFPLWTVSCVDNKYDLDKDIDMTINVGGEYLTIPAGSTDTTFLSKIIEVEEGDILQPDATTRVYHLTKKDDINVEPTTVKEVTVGATTTDLESIEIVNNTGVSFSEPEVSADITTSGDFEATANDIDEALKELGSLRAKTPVDLNLTIDFNISGGNLTFNQVKANKLKLVFPDYIVFKEDEGIQDNELILDEEVLSVNGSSYTRTLKVEGYKFSDAAGSGMKLNAEGSLTIEGNISMEGDVVTSGISGTGTLALVPKAVLEEMTVNSVTGVIQPKIEAETTKIELNDLPDFLKDEDTRLDITNPVILLKADNPLETDVEIDAVLTPKKNNVRLEPGEMERGLTFLGLFGLMDPPRPEAKRAVERCHLAGVRPVMITGDHRETAAAVARELGIANAGDLTITGPELDFMPQEMLEQDIEKFAVFARVSPEHKMRIVQAWQKKGHVVAMTGDGVNDAPALKAADIGCAMGRTGTDVAKGAAHMILTDDNFSTIVSAIEEGRGDFTPVFFSEIPELFRTNLHPNVVLLHLSTPDEHGYCSFGVSCDYTKPAAECADLLIAQINPKMPRTMGDSFIHVSKLDYIVEQETDLIELAPPHIGDVERAIGENIASLVKDGGVSMDDCVAMSRALQEPLDQEDPIKEAYTLEVSSPGIERELVQDSHFLQYIGAPVLVRTIRPVDGARDFSGTLEQYNNGEITVRLTSGKALCVQKKDTAFVKLDDFNIADFEQDFQE